MVQCDDSAEKIWFEHRHRAHAEDTFEGNHSEAGMPESHGRKSDKHAESP